MKKLVTLIVGIFMTCSLFAQAEMQVLPNDPAVKVGKLKNGLTYYIRHNERPEGRAEFYLATNVGAIQETPDQDGLAHFLEHMCFNGTKNFPGKSLLDYLQSIGASFGGNVNASTGVEQTQYMLTNIPIVNQSVIDSCILIMHDYSHFVTNDPAEIDKERGVIVEERRARRDASWRLHERSLPYYYGDSKYATCTLIGSQENLLNFKPESLVNFYKTWYRPDLQALIVVGDVDVDYVEAKIKEIFADIPAAVNPKAKDVHMVPGNVEPIVGILTDPEQASSSIQLLWKSDAAPKEINNTVVGKLTDLLKSITSRVFAERLTDIAAKPDAPFLSADVAMGNMTTTMEVLLGQLSVKEGEAISGFKSFLTEMEKAKRFGFAEDEVNRAKEAILSAYETAAKNADTRTSPQLIPELMNHFFENYAFMEPSQEYALVQQLLGMINADVVNQVLGQVITDENMVVIYTAPEKDGLVHPSEDDFLTAIKEVKASDIKANEVEVIESSFLDPSQLKGSPVKKESKGVYGSTVWTLKNGVKVVLYPTDYEKDRVSFNFFKAGGLSLASDEEVLSFDENIWTLFLQNSGISRFPSGTVSKMLSGKNLSVSPYFNSIRHGISGLTTPKDIETAFQLAYLYFVDPRFDEDEYNQGINTIKAILPNMASQPNFQFQKILNEVIYGGHPRRMIISEELLQKASLENIEKVYRRLFNDAAGAELVIVGDFVPEAIKPMVEKYFGSIPKGKKAYEWTSTNSEVVDDTIVKDFEVDMQTPMTTVMSLYKRPMPFSYKRQVEMEALSYILNMRYVTSLREEEGGTYGAQTVAEAVNAPEEYLLLQIAFNSKPALADRLRELALVDLEKLASEGPTAEEFDMTKKNLEKNIPESKIKNSYWLGAIVVNESLGLDRVNDYEAAVNSLTAEDVQKAAKEILSGNHIEVIMRPGETVESE